MLLLGDSKEMLKTLPDDTIDMCITSPPYYGLRDYGVDGQLGLEPTVDGYIDNLCSIFDEVARVLRPTGTCWVNLGDSYGGSGNSSGHTCHTTNLGRKTSSYGATKGHTVGMKPKSLLGVPFRFALEMMNRGWILRNTIIWHKPSCMPSSIKDRFTVDFEYLFFFARGQKYYFEQQLEPLKRPVAKSKNATNKHKGYGNPTYSGFEYDAANYPNGRNKRCVWSINTARCKEAHFAVFPEELIDTPISAGCPELVCSQCGEPKKISFEVIDNNRRPVIIDKGQPYEVYSGRAGDVKREKVVSSCECNAGFKPGVVLDPFFGAGTTGVVALKQHKDFIGIELNPDYVKIAEERIAKVTSEEAVFEFLQEAVC